MKILNDIINWIINSGFLALLIYIAVAFGKPFCDSKIKHAKTAQQREVWTLLEQVAMNYVNSLVSSDKSGSQKFLEASDQVQSYLADHGVCIDMQTVQSAVRAAYEKSPLTPTKQPVDPVKEAIKMAPNRADKLLVADGSITQAKG